MIKIVKSKSPSMRGFWAYVEVDGQMQCVGFSASKKEAEQIARNWCVS